MPVYLLKKGPLERTKILKVDGDIQVNLKPVLCIKVFWKIILVIYLLHLCNKQHYLPLLETRKEVCLHHALYLWINIHSHMQDGRQLWSRHRCSKKKSPQSIIVSKYICIYHNSTKINVIHQVCIILLFFSIPAFLWGSKGILIFEISIQDTLHSYQWNQQQSTCPGRLCWWSRGVP